jgi:hypothetical protein
VYTPNFKKATQLEKSEVIKSKLYKSIKSVRTSMEKAPIIEKQLYNEDQIEVIKVANILAIYLAEVDQFK